MRKSSVTIFLLFLLTFGVTRAQEKLSIEKIMRGEFFTGFSPENIQWSPSGKKLYFTWNSEMEPVRSLYAIETGNLKPAKVSPEERKNLPSGNFSFNRDRSRIVYSSNGDLFLMDLKNENVVRITSTSGMETMPEFSPDGSKVNYMYANNLYSWEINTGIITQLTDLRAGKEKKSETERSKQDSWLYEDQLNLFSVLDERKEKREKSRKDAETLSPASLKTIYTGSDQVTSFQLTPDQKYITWISYQPGDDKRTVVPNYVTESGYTEDIQARSKVGSSSYSSAKLNIRDIQRDTVYSAGIDKIDGIAETPGYMKDYTSAKSEKAEKRSIIFSDPIWSDDGKYSVVDIYSNDHKDRWIMLLDIKTGGLKLLDRQHDEAWIGGPGIRGRGSLGWLPDNKKIFFQSEESGYSHLYTIDVVSAEKKALTSGNFEVYDLQLSANGKAWYFISNESHPGIRELYKMPVAGGPRTQITNFGGGVEYKLSPDEKFFALRVSYPTQPWELFLLENKEKAVSDRITESTTPQFKSYSWRVPEFKLIKASDGKTIPARLYQPANPLKKGPAVIFVHGAGYLQNAHKWWSSYFREYMFHNFLVDNGYTVLDIDYRGSSGYGRDWRTGIYRHMGGRDLDDHVDAARYLTELGVDPAKIGIYGGSYGGFITLMALFTKPGTFSAGAALRPVTDWAHYNHGYTSNILNTPVTDSIAYAKSSPIYFADGLTGSLLICHGMVDDNVHFQDVVRLVQKLIELGKEDWELAVFPVEAHAFTEPSSWTDEYRRIFRLFEEKLK